MTRPEMRGPRPGEMLRQAATRGSASAREATPWRAQAAARGLSALDRQQIAMDQRAWGWVQDARAEIEQAEADIADAVVQLGALDGRMAETETAVEDAAQAVAVVRDETIPALTGRLDVTEGRVDTVQNTTLPALDASLSTLRDETIPELEAVVGPLPGQVSDAQGAAEAAAAAATAAEARAAEANNRAMTRLANGNFEDGLKYWKPLSSIVLTEDSHSGAQAAHLTNTTARLEPESALPVVAGQIWELSLFYKSSIDDPGANMTASLRDTAGATVGTYATLSPTGGEWAASGPIRVTIPDGIDMVTTHILPRSVSGTGWVVDDITLRDVTDVVRLEEAANAARTRADSAHDRADALDGLVGTLRTDLDAAAGRIDTVQDVTLPALAGDLSDLGTSMSDLEGVVGPLPGRITAAKSAADAAQAEADAAMLAASGKASVVAAPTAPTPGGDTLWIDTSDGNKPKVWIDYGPGPRANLAPNTLTHVTSGAAPVMGSTEIIDGFLRLTSTQEASPLLPRVQAVGTSNGRADVTPDTDYLISVEVRGQVDPDNRIEFRDYQMSAENQYQGRSGYYFAPSDGTWHTIRLVLHTLPDVTKLGWQIGSENPLTPGRYIDARNLFIEQSSDVDAVPFNGDSTGAEWTGTPGWSTSIYDGPGWYDARDESISAAQAAADAAQAKADALEGTVGTLRTDLDAAEVAVATVRDQTIPALDGRLEAAEYDVKHISGEWVTAGTIDTARLNANTIAAAVATIIELNADRITSGTVNTDRLNATQIAARVASVIELDAGRITTGELGANRIAVNELAVEIADVIELNADRITSGTIATGRLDAEEVAGAVGSFLELNAAQITSGTIKAGQVDTVGLSTEIATVIELDAGRVTTGTIDTARLNAAEIAAATATLIELDADRIVSGTIDTARLSAPEIWGQIATIGRIVTEDLIAANAVTADALNIVSTAGEGHSWRLDKQGLVAMRTASQAAMHIDSGGLRMWDEAGDLTVRVNGVQNLLIGSVRTTAPQSGVPGVIVAQDGQNRPGVWLSEEGQGGQSQPGMVLQDLAGYGAVADIQHQYRTRYQTWRVGTLYGSTTNQRGGTRGPGALSWTANRGAPATLAQESLFARVDGFFTVVFTAQVSVRPTSSRAFLTIVRNSGTAARTSMGEEDISTVNWTGWLSAGDRLDFTSWYAGTGSYAQSSWIAILYHGL